MHSTALGILLLVSPLCVLADLEALYPGLLRQPEYDYIIVGAGSAGSVLANRLSEDPESSVLLLEAGGTPPDISEIPLFQSQLITSEVDWGYFTEPQTKACLGLDGQRSYYPRGKVLGGTSTINSMLYVRGNHRDYDHWQEQGAVGWSWRHVFPYFTKSEDQTDVRYLRNGFHKRGGSLTISSNTFATPLRDAYLEAAESLGIPQVDVNGGAQLGITPIQSTMRDGLRCSTEKAFLRPVVHRPNLDIVTHAHVTRIMFDADKRARWVRFEHLNGSLSVVARKEIILSAGTIGSPQILMLSGIGPKEHLEEIGIPVISDLPVGQNLQDHLTTGGQVYLLNSTVGLVFPRDIDEKAIGDLQGGKGPLSTPSYLEDLAFVNTVFNPVNYSWPDIQMFFVASMYLPTLNKKAAALMEKYKGLDVTSILPMILRPKSRGFIKLNPENPFGHPIIDPKYLTEDEDLHTLVEGMKIAERMIRSYPLQKFGPVRIPEVVLGCEGIDTESDAYLECLARTLSQTTSHQCGTCKMGDPWDPSTVVDPELRVKGVKGLRVADASIMPTVPSGNINAACIMIGEKASDIIRGRF